MWFIIELWRADLNDVNSIFILIHGFLDTLLFDSSELVFRLLILTLLVIVYHLGRRSFVSESFAILIEDRTETVMGDNFSFSALHLLIINGAIRSSHCRLLLELWFTEMVWVAINNFTGRELSRRIDYHVVLADLNLLAKFLWADAALPRLRTEESNTLIWAWRVTLFMLRKGWLWIKVATLPCNLLIEVEHWVHILGSIGACVPSCPGLLAHPLYAGILQITSHRLTVKLCIGLIFATSSLSVYHGGTTAASLV